MSNANSENGVNFSIIRLESAIWACFGPRFDIGRVNSAFCGGCRGCPGVPGVAGGAGGGRGRRGWPGAPGVAGGAGGVAARRYDEPMRWWRQLVGRFGGRGGPGRRGERAAASHLKRQGYRVIAKNVSNRQGEVDILAEAPDGRTIVIVEVKASAQTEAGSPRPEVHVNRAKQRQLTALATQLARRHRFTDRPIRFDVMGVDLCDGKPPVVRHHEGAFEAAY